MPGKIIVVVALGLIIGSYALVSAPLWQLVDSLGKLNRLERALKLTSAPVCVDTEADMQMFHYHTRLCLVQLEVDGECFIIDPLVCPAGLSSTFTTQSQHS